MMLFSQAQKEPGVERRRCSCCNQSGQAQEQAQMILLKLLPELFQEFQFSAAQN